MDNETIPIYRKKADRRSIPFKYSIIKDNRERSWSDETSKRKTVSLMTVKCTSGDDRKKDSSFNKVFLENGYKTDTGAFLNNYSFIYETSSEGNVC